MKNCATLFLCVLFLQFTIAVSCPGAVSAKTLQRADTDSLGRRTIPEDILLKPTIFEVDKWVVPSQAELDRMARMVNMVSSDTSVVYWNVTVRGAASPEGPLSRNILLGHNRARQLSDYLLAKVPGVNSSNMVVINMEEDWDSLVAVLDTVDFEGKEQVLEIIASQPDREKRKTEIKAIDGGATWSRLLDELFPQLRYARAYIHLERPADPEPALPPGDVPTDSPKQPESVLELPLHSVTYSQPKSFIALKTNALHLAALTANLGFEVGFADRWSLDVPVWYSPYDITDKFRLRLLAIQPELRWWLKDNMWQGHFFGLHGSAIGYNVSINDRGRFQDPNSAAWGLGLGYGYAMNFGREKRFGLEFNVGAGFCSYKFDAYENRYNGQKFNSGSGCYWGLTRAGISLYYRWYKSPKGNNR